MVNATRYLNFIQMNDARPPPPLALSLTTNPGFVHTHEYYIRIYLYAHARVCV